MKLRGNGVSGWYDPKQVASAYHYNPSLCRPYYIPISDETVDNFYWYTEFTGEPSAVEFYCYNECTEEKTVIQPEFYVVGKNTDDNWYTTLNGLKGTFPCGEFSQIGVKATVNGQEWWYWSEVYQIDQCGASPINCSSNVYNVDTQDRFETVFSCYSSNDNGGYDDNGIYLGKAKSAKFGDRGVRYYHNFPLRGLKVVYGGTRFTYTTLNNRPTKNSIERTYFIRFEVVPYWYEEQFSNSFAKGVIVIDGQQYTIIDYSTSPVGNECCERFNVSITAQKTSKIGKTVTFSCSSDACTPPVLDCRIETAVIKDPSYDCTMSGMQIINIDCEMSGMTIV